MTGEQIKKGVDYWRYNDVTRLKMRQKGGRIDGYGLKIFPEDAKKDLEFFNE